MNIINILPLTLLEFQANEDLVLDTLNKIKRLEWNKNIANKISKDSLNSKEEFKELHEWFAKCLEEARVHFKFPFEKIVLTQSWANKTITNEQHHLHTHPNSLISGIFYLTSHESGATFFEKEDSWKTNLFFNNDSNKINTKIKPTSGKLLLFPSQIRHGVTKIESLEERYSIAFNAFPSGKIGYFAAGLNLITSEFN